MWGQFNTILQLLQANKNFPCNASWQEHTMQSKQSEGLTKEKKQVILYQDQSAEI